VRVRVRVRGRPFASLLHRVSEGEGGWMCEGVLVARMQDDNLYLCLYLRGSSPIMPKPLLSVWFSLVLGNLYLFSSTFVSTGLRAQWLSLQSLQSLQSCCS